MGESVTLGVPPTVLCGADRVCLNHPNWEL
jgi:hypothetical protein